MNLQPHTTYQMVQFGNYLNMAAISVLHLFLKCTGRVVVFGDAW